MKTYTFNDVLIKPKYSEVLTRTNVDTSVKLGQINLDIPVMSANMRTITGPRMATEMYNRGAIGVLHRFNDIEDAVNDFKEVQYSTVYSGCRVYRNNEKIERGCSVVSIGVNGDHKERFKALYNVGARYFCIDIAHGHHINMCKTLSYIRSEVSDACIIAGNVATSDGAVDLWNWGANVVKVGIGPGSMCQTRTNTGVGVPQLWALEQIRDQIEDRVQLVADGGIKTIGDIAKALKFADFVMLGSFFAGSMETPGNVYKRKDGSRYKVYGGSASGHNKVNGDKKPEFVEGVTEEVPLGDHVKFLLKEIKEGLQSSCSYVGANNLEEFKRKCEFIQVSGGGKEESKF